jgi:hypothetical protein
VGLVVPGRNRRPLHELLRSGADGGTKGAKGGDELRGGGDEAGAVAGHRRTLAEGVEDRHVRAVSYLEGGGGRLDEPELAVGLVRGEHEVVRAGELREPLVERERRRCARGVVRVVDPEERHLVPLVEGVEVGQEAVLPEERKPPNARTGKQRPPLGHRIAGLRDDDEVALALGVDDDLREREDGLLRAERWDDLRRRVELHAEAPRAPAGDRLAQLREPLRERVAGALRQRIDQRLPDEGRGRLARVADSEVEDLHAVDRNATLRLLQAHERIRRLAREHGGEAHG